MALTTAPTKFIFKTALPFNPEDFDGKTVKVLTVDSTNPTIIHAESVAHLDTDAASRFYTRLGFFPFFEMVDGKVVIKRVYLPEYAGNFSRYIKEYLIPNCKDALYEKVRLGLRALKKPDAGTPSLGGDPRINNVLTTILDHLCTELLENPDNMGLRAKLGNPTAADVMRSIRKHEKRTIASHELSDMKRKIAESTIALAAMKPTGAPADHFFEEEVESILAEL